jgi:hypothetical protein
MPKKLESAPAIRCENWFWRTALKPVRFTWALVFDYTFVNIPVAIQAASIKRAVPPGARSLSKLHAFRAV